MTHYPVTMQDLVTNPIAITAAIIGCARALVGLWVAIVKGISITAAEYDRKRNRVFVKRIFTVFGEVLNKINAPSTLPPNASRLRRGFEWFSVGVSCVFVAWFAIYAVCVAALGLIFFFNKYIAAFLLSLLTVGCLVMMGKYFYRQAHSIRRALIETKPR